MSSCSLKKKIIFALVVIVIILFLITIYMLITRNNKNVDNYINGENNNIDNSNEGNIKENFGATINTTTSPHKYLDFLNNVRYIQINLQSINALNIAQVQVFDTTTPNPVNIALNKKATQSSTLTDFGGNSHKATLAVNGSSTTSLIQTRNAGTVTHTIPTSPNNNFWEVDLNRETSISSIKIFNRTDCCSERIIGATVYLLNNDRNVVYQLINPLNGNNIQELKKINFSYRMIMRNVRYIELKKTPNATIKPIAIAQLQAFAYTPNSNIPDEVANKTNPNNPKAYQSSTVIINGYKHPADLAINGNIRQDFFYDNKNTNKTDIATNIASTMGTGQEWWYVDLQQPQDIVYLTVFNRNDPCDINGIKSCQNYMNDVYINLYSDSVEIDPITKKITGIPKYTTKQLYNWNPANNSNSTLPFGNDISSNNSCFQYFSLGSFIRPYLNSVQVNDIKVSIATQNGKLSIGQIIPITRGYNSATPLPLVNTAGNPLSPIQLPPLINGNDGSVLSFSGTNVAEDPAHPAIYAINGKNSSVFKNNFVASTLDQGINPQWRLSLNTPITMYGFFITNLDNNVNLKDAVITLTTNIGTHSIKYDPLYDITNILLADNYVSSTFTIENNRDVVRQQTFYLSDMIETPFVTTTTTPTTTIPTTTTPTTTIPTNIPTTTPYIPTTTPYIPTTTIPPCYKRVLGNIDTCNNQDNCYKYTPGCIDLSNFGNIQNAKDFSCSLNKTDNTDNPYTLICFNNNTSDTNDYLIKNISVINDCDDYSYCNLLIPPGGVDPSTANIKQYAAYYNNTKNNFTRNINISEDNYNIIKDQKNKLILTDYKNNKLILDSTTNNLNIIDSGDSSEKNVNIDFINKIIFNLDKAASNIESSTSLIT
jgi:hypothetical protein